MPVEMATSAVGKGWMRPTAPSRALGGRAGPIEVVALDVDELVEVVHEVGREPIAGVGHVSP
jgi:hypothetical protein